MPWCSSYGAVYSLCKTSSVLAFFCSMRYLNYGILMLVNTHWLINP